MEDLGIPQKDFAPIFFEEICIPPYRGEETLNDYSVLFSILDFSKPKEILELGTGYGNITANICASLDSQVFTLNALPEQISGRETTYTLTSDEIGQVYKAHGCSERIVQLFADTKKMELKKYLPVRGMDFAIVDACHDADYVMNDFLKIQPFMAPASIVLLHDTHPSMRNHYIDSYIACMYLRKLGHNIKFVKNTSWAIWFETDRTIKKNLMSTALSLLSNFVIKLIFKDHEKNLLSIRANAKKSLP